MGDSMKCEGCDRPVADGEYVLDVEGCPLCKPCAAELESYTGRQMRCIACGHLWCVAVEIPPGAKPPPLLAFDRLLECPACEKKQGEIIGWTRYETDMEVVKAG